jgi:Zn-dependent peptidase ImmA (M78 family)
MIKAQEIAALLNEARAAWSLDDATLAAKAHLDLKTTRAALRGKADVSDLAALARALGGTLDDLLARRPFWKAPSIAFKSAPSTFEMPLVRAALLRVSSAARDRAALAEILALPEPTRAGGPTLDRVPVAGDVTLQAEELARSVRRVLENENEPIASVREAMRRLGVSTFLTDVTIPEVDGMIWRDKAGLTCAAANVQARGGKLTALRMTFAHELCHAVFDGTRLPAFGLVEARSDHSGREQRANAFAAHLLAPRGAVRRFLAERGLREHDNPSAMHLRALSEHFGMGVEAMAGHLVSCNLWSKARHPPPSRAVYQGRARPGQRRAVPHAGRRADPARTPRRAARARVAGPRPWRHHGRPLARGPRARPVRRLARAARRTTGRPGCREPLGAVACASRRAACSSTRAPSCACGNATPWARSQEPCDSTSLDTSRKSSGDKAPPSVRRSPNSRPRLTRCGLAPVHGSCSDTYGVGGTRCAI